ncbi:hypothetical protein Tco_1218078 [Tanacetum coccineum]
MVAENTKKTPQEVARVPTCNTSATPKSPTSHHTVIQTKPAHSSDKETFQRKRSTEKLEKGKQLSNMLTKTMKAQQESISQREDDDPDLEWLRMSLETPTRKREWRRNQYHTKLTSKLHEVVGKGESLIVTEERSLRSSFPGDLSKKKEMTSHSVLSLLERDQTPSDRQLKELKVKQKAAASKGDKDHVKSLVTVTSELTFLYQPCEALRLWLDQTLSQKEDQTGSDSGKLHVSLARPNPEHMDDEFLATAYPKVHENLKLITDERVIDDKPESHSGSMSSLKNLDDSFKLRGSISQAPNQPKIIMRDLSAESASALTDGSSSKPSLLVTPPPINTEATTITTLLPDITHHRLSVRVDQDSSKRCLEVKKTDHICSVLALIQPKFLRLVDNYLGAKLDDALLSHMNKKKSANKNTTNYRLYHALMEAFIAMKKPVTGSADQLNLLRKMMNKVIESQGVLMHLIQTNIPFPSRDDRFQDTRDAGADSSMHNLIRVQNHSEQSSDDISKHDEGNDSDMEDTDNAHIPKVMERARPNGLKTFFCSSTIRAWRHRKWSEDDKKEAQKDKTSSQQSKKSQIRRIQSKSRKL